MIDALVGGLLVISGAILGLVGNYWIETRRWKREDRIRYHEDRYRTYTDFYKAASDFSSKLWLDVVDEGPDFVEEDHRQLVLKLMNLKPHIEMVASTPVREVARQITYQIERAAVDGPTSINEEAGYANVIGKLSNEFAEAARKELGMAVINSHKT